MSEIVHTPRQYHHFTDERRELCLKALAMGYTRTAACAAAGIDKQTFYNWLSNSTDSTQGHGSPESFAQLVEQAEARAQGRAETIIVSRISEDPSLAWRWLRRHRRRDWGDPEQEARIKEIQGRIELARMELELARLERELLDIDIEKARDGGKSAFAEHEGGAGQAAERAHQEIIIEYVDHAPDTDSEAP